MDLTNLPMAMTFIPICDLVSTSLLTTIPIFQPPSMKDADGESSSGKPVRRKRTVPQNYKHEMMVLGLDNGDVQIYDVGSCNNGKKTIPCHTRFHVRDDWITSILPTPHLDSLITCSMDCTIRFSSVELELLHASCADIAKL